MKKPYLAPAARAVAVKIEKGFAGSYNSPMMFDGHYIEDWNATIEYEGEAVEDNSDFWN